MSNSSYFQSSQSVSFLICFPSTPPKLCSISLQILSNNHLLCIDYQPKPNSSNLQISSFRVLQQHLFNIITNGMNTPKSVHIMTQIKNQNQEKNRRKYYNNRQQRALNYYQQYRDRIVFIQRWYRSRMAAANRKAETLFLAKLHKNEQLQLIKQEVTERLMRVSQKRALLMEEKENLVLNNLQKQIENKLRKAVSGTLQRAELSALINGKAKYALSQIKNLRQKCESTQGEVEALKFEYECYLKRRQEWQLKLKTIRNSISNQTQKSKQTKQKIIEIQTQLMIPSARTVCPQPN